MKKREKKIKRLKFQMLLFVYNLYKKEKKKEYDHDNILINEQIISTNDI